MTTNAERLRWTVAETVIGPVLLVTSDRGIVAVCITPDIDEELERVRSEFPGVPLVRDDAGMEVEARGIAALARGASAQEPLPTDVRGTAFQAEVWAALRQIPSGTTQTYADVAAAIGRPTAVRAVARACAANPVALVIPCHRVIRRDGGLGGFGWGGPPVKASLLAAEAAWERADRPR